MCIITTNGANPVPTEISFLNGTPKLFNYLCGQYNTHTQVYNGRSMKLKKPKKPELPVIWVEGEKLDEKTGKMIPIRYKLKVCS